MPISGKGSGRLRGRVKRQAPKPARVARRPAAVQPRAPRRRTQEERSAQTRGKLIDAAQQILREQGYSNLTISKVSQRAGVTNGAMQHHFPSREDLLLTLMDAVYPVLQIPFDTIGGAGLPVRERISRVVDQLWSIYSRPEYLAVWDIALGARGDPKLWARVSAYQQQITARMRDQFAALFGDLGVAPDDAEHVLSLTVNHIRGIAFLMLFGTEHLHEAEFALIKDVAYGELMKRVKAAPANR
jgi:AcrR family transcriptional regulator